MFEYIKHPTDNPADDFRWTDLFFLLLPLIWAGVSIGLPVYLSLR